MRVRLCADGVCVPPVLGVRRSLLQPEQSEAGRAERQTSDAVAPLLLCSEHTHTHISHDAAYTDSETVH